MLRTRKPCQRGVRSYHALNEALTAVASNRMSQEEASKVFKIPRQTIGTKLSGKNAVNVAAPLTFTHKEEELFCIQVIAMCNWGFPIDTFDLRMIVAAYLSINNIPGSNSHVKI